MVANRMSRTIVTAPMTFLAFGALLATGGLTGPVDTEALHVVAEIALVVLLFLDAAQIDQRALYASRVWPKRMLLIGLPLGFLFGVVWGLLVLPDWPLAIIMLVAAILVPTDAALGQAVISNPDVPDRPRRALTVESGLNDGLALPIVLIMAGFAAPMALAPEEGWLYFTFKQVTFGPLVGGVLGYLAGHVMLWAQRTGLSSSIYEGIGALALAALAYLSANAIGGNGFIAAFTCGLGFGAVVRGQCAFVFEFAESEGQLLSWMAFLLLGVVLVPDAMTHLTAQTALLILGSLLIVRPLAIYISLMGTDANRVTRLFFGWFGPRGLATALFALLVIEQLEPEWEEAVLHLAVNAVWISALLHGVTAVPGAKLYAKLMQKSTD